MNCKESGLKVLALQGLIGEDQEAIVLPALHQLASHPSLAIALAAAYVTSSESRFVHRSGDQAGHPTQLQGTRRARLDGDVMLERLLASHDALAALV
jgi:hypothetical protein